MDVVERLLEAAPEGVEVKQLAGRVVWLREAEREWLGPAEEALARLHAIGSAKSFWSAFACSGGSRPAPPLQCSQHEPL